MVKCQKKEKRVRREAGDMLLQTEHVGGLRVSTMQSCLSNVS